MSVAHPPLSQTATKHPSGLRLLLLESILAAQISPAPYHPMQSPTDAPALVPVGARTPLHRQLVALCLNNPYWNDFHLLNYFNKRKNALTLEGLTRLKEECGLDKRETVCNTLIRLAMTGGLKLNSRQISFIEKVSPAFRDRDLSPSQPGELLVYHCLFGRGVGSLGRVHVHLFVDLFNGYTFGEISSRRTVSTGLRLLKETILPFYLAHNLSVQTIAHSTRVLSDMKEYNEMESAETFSKVGLQWLLTRREFGVIEKFARDLLRNDFFECREYKVVSLAKLQASLTQRLAKYNAANRLLRHRSQDTNE